jgi:hypothetical protein
MSCAVSSRIAGPPICTAWKQVLERRRGWRSAVAAAQSTTCFPTPCWVSVRSMLQCQGISRLMRRGPALRSTDRQFPGPEGGEHPQTS